MNFSISIGKKPEDELAQIAKRDRAAGTNNAKNYYVAEKGRCPAFNTGRSLEHELLLKASGTTHLESLTQTLEAIQDELAKRPSTWLLVGGLGIVGFAELEGFSLFWSDQGAVTLAKLVLALSSACATIFMPWCCVRYGKKWMKDKAASKAEQATRSPNGILFFGCLIATVAWFYYLGTARGKTLVAGQDNSIGIITVMLAGALAFLGDVLIRELVPIMALKKRRKLYAARVKTEARKVNDGQQGIIKIQRSIFAWENGEDMAVAKHTIAHDHAGIGTAAMNDSPKGDPLSGGVAQMPTPLAAPKPNGKLPSWDE